MLWFIINTLLKNFFLLHAASVCHSSFLMCLNYSFILITESHHGGR